MMFERARLWLARKALERDIARGRRPWGRQPQDPVNDQHDPDVPSGRVGVRVPLKATIAATVIRADGTVEELGVLSNVEGDIDPMDLEGIRRQAEGNAP